MKKGLVLFAATSMLAAGVSLAANVSFGQKMATMFANAFEFVGPVSGLVHALVKPKNEQKAPVMPGFQDGPNGLSGSDAAPTPAPLKGSGLPPRFNVTTAAPAVAPQETRRSLEEESRIPATASALSTRSMVQEGTVAKAIVESGDGAILASLGHSLQTKQPEFTATLSQDVWAHLMNKPALVGEPLKLAMNSQISTKQIEAGAAIASNISSQGQSPSAAGIYAQSTAVAGSTDSTGAGTGSAANQITSSSLSRVGTSAPAGGQIPIPGSWSLLLAGLVLLGAKYRFKHLKGLN